MAFRWEKQEDIMGCWNQEEQVETEEQKRKKMLVEGFSQLFTNVRDYPSCPAHNEGAGGWGRQSEMWIVFFFSETDSRRRDGPAEGRCAVFPLPSSTIPCLY